MTFIPKGVTNLALALRSLSFNSLLETELKSAFPLVNHLSVESPSLQNIFPLCDLDDTSV